MKHLKLLALMILVSISTQASTTLPIQGKVIKPTDKNIQYVGRICFDHPERPRFTFPGTQINICFTGTSVKLWAKPHSGYFMAQVDQAEPFKVALMSERDSIVTVATALPQGCHTLRLMYIIEGYELKPDYSMFLGHFMPYNVSKIILTSVYDVYDTNTTPEHPNGNLIRKDCEATNTLSMSQLFSGQTVSHRGWKYKVRLTINPTYLYVMSDPDLNNPTVVVEN
jgi:hypothetical protein